MAQPSASWLSRGPHSSARACLRLPHAGQPQPIGWAAALACHSGLVFRHRRIPQLLSAARWR
eukprot:scaffold20321_cov31-Phaeocystis_antarctica.AAC.2